MNYINNPLPDPEDYSYEWTNSKLFVNEANYMKKQYFFSKKFFIKSQDFII